ncbi:MAG: REP-associated tyrosine transposase [Oscillospiraceae bacterium]
MEKPERKPNRLKEYDYSQPGAYFVTVCTKNRSMLFGPVGADSISARMIERTFLETIEQYPNVNAPVYVVMPNHFHAILTLSRADMESAPTISQVIQSFKRYSTIEYIKLVKAGVLPPFHGQVWQRSFYDHIIRNDDDYRTIWEYIENNPAKWKEDRFYIDPVM